MNMCDLGILTFFIMRYPLSLAVNPYFGPMSPTSIPGRGLSHISSARRVCQVLWGERGSQGGHGPRREQCSGQRPWLRSTAARACQQRLCSDWLSERSMHRGRRQGNISQRAAPLHCSSPHVEVHVPWPRPPAVSGHLIEDPARDVESVVRAIVVQSVSRELVVKG